MRGMMVARMCGTRSALKAGMGGLGFGGCETANGEPTEGPKAGPHEDQG